MRSASSTLGVGRVKGVRGDVGMELDRDGKGEAGRERQGQVKATQG